MTGFLFVDKPSGITSFDVVRYIRRLLPKKTKVGHTGTLDPLATGLLIVSVGKATRFGEYLLKQDKCYEVSGRFGFLSDTYDIDGNVKKVPVSSISDTEMKGVVVRFEGDVEQVPPPFSAIRVDGKRAYELARKGEKVKLSSRKVQIYQIDLLSFEFPDFSMKVCCSSGTYIRSLIHDIGLSFGTNAIVSALRRISIGNVDVKKAVELSSLSKENVENYLKSVSDILPFKKLTLDFQMSEWFKHGRKVKLGLGDNKKYTVLNESGEFLGIGVVNGGVLKPEKVISS